MEDSSSSAVVVVLYIHVVYVLTDHILPCFRNKLDTVYEMFVCGLFPFLFLSFLPISCFCSFSFISFVQYMLKFSSSFSSLYKYL